MPDTSLVLHDEPFDPAQPSRGGWAYIELLGHRSHWGFVREVLLFGLPMIQIFVCERDSDALINSPIHAPSALYGISPCNKAECRQNAPFIVRHDRPQLTIGDVDSDDDGRDYGDDNA